MWKTEQPSSQGEPLRNLPWTFCLSLIKTQSFEVFSFLPPSFCSSSFSSYVFLGVKPVRSSQLTENVFQMHTTQWRTERIGVCLVVAQSIKINYVLKIKQLHFFPPSQKKQTKKNSAPVTLDNPQENTVISSRTRSLSSGVKSFQWKQFFFFPFHLWHELTL